LFGLLSPPLFPPLFGKAPGLPDGDWGNDPEGLVGGLLLLPLLFGNDSGAPEGDWGFVPLGGLLLPPLFPSFGKVFGPV
jgi:hypothetical protein